MCKKMLTLLLACVLLLGAALAPPAHAMSYEVPVDKVPGYLPEPLPPDADYAPVAASVSQEQARAIAEATFVVPAELSVFRAHYNENFWDGRVQRYWTLWWSTPDEQFAKPSNLHIDIDADTGDIRSMHYWQGWEQDGVAPGANYTRAEAQAVAEEFLQRAIPERLGQMRLEPQVPRQPWHFGSRPSWTFSWTRLYEGRPLFTAGQPEGAHVEIDAVSGKVLSFRQNWQTDVATLPEAVPWYTPENARDAFLQITGFELHYRQFWDSLTNQPSVRLVYGSPFLSGYSFLSARTNSLIFGGGQGVKILEPAQVVTYTAADTDLPAADLPLTRDGAEALARAYTDLGPEFTLSYVTYNDAYQPTDVASWQLHFTKDSKDDGWQHNTWVQINAETGDLMHMSQNRWPDWPQDWDQDAPEPAVTRAEALSAALQYLGRVAPRQAGNYVLAPLTSIDPPFVPKGPQAPNHYFNLYGLIGDLPFIGPSLSVVVDGETGKVTSVYLPWQQHQFNFTDPAASVDHAAALATLSEQLLPELGYLVPDAYGWDDMESLPLLVYRLPEIYQGAMVDAVSGRIIDGQGIDLLAWLQGPQDIADHPWARELEIAVAQGLLQLTDGKVNPDAAVSRAEATRIVLLGMGRGEIRPLRGSFTDVPSAHSLYGYVEAAAAAGLVDTAAAEFRPDDAITREEFAAMLVRALGYDRVARMPLELPLPVADAAQTSAALRNYVALALGLGAMERADDAFRPADALSRVEAVLAALRIPHLRSR